MKRSGLAPKPDWKPLQRKTPLKPSSKPMARGTSTLKPVGARAKRTGQGKVKPTAEEAAWMAAIAQFCIVCRIYHGVTVLAEVHHLKQGDRRMGHLFSIGLCTLHHRGGEGEGPFISRHPWKKRFEHAYAPEMSLLEMQRELISHPADNDASTEPAHLGNPQNPD
jgi:hypothetical protein